MPRTRRRRLARQRRKHGVPVTIEGKRYYAKDVAKALAERAAKVGVIPVAHDLTAKRIEVAQERKEKGPATPAHKRPEAKAAKKAVKKLGHRA